MRGQSLLLSLHEKVESFCEYPLYFFCFSFLRSFQQNRMLIDTQSVMKEHIEIYWISVMSHFSRFFNFTYTVFFLFYALFSWHKKNKVELTIKEKKREWEGDAKEIWKINWFFTLSFSFFLLWIFFSFFRQLFSYQKFLFTWNICSQIIYLIQ